MSSTVDGPGALRAPVLSTVHVPGPAHDPRALLGADRQPHVLVRLLGGPFTPSLAVVLVLAALPFIRPNLFGEALSPIGSALILAAAGLMLLSARFDPPAPADGSTAVASLVPLVAFLGLAYLWLMVQATVVDPVEWFLPAVQGLVLTVGTVAALTVVCRNPRTGVVLVRGFVLLLVAMCASYAVTAGIWALGGVGTGRMFMIPIYGSPEPVYFPFTTTQSHQKVLGVDYPRFTGLGREPGWMAMYLAAAYYLADMVGLARRWVKALLLVGLVGTISTAGFGVFVVVWAYRTFLRDRGTGIGMAQYLRQLAGIGAIPLAVWTATSAPIFGLSAKATQNETSLDERLLATEAGVRALVDSPFGGVPTEAQGGINLIADIAVGGLPFVVLVCAAILLTRGRAPLRGAVALVVFFTLLTSQPAKDSTWAFGVIALASAVPGPALRPKSTQPGGSP